MPKTFRFLIALLCFVGFAFIRFRESELFYDPLISFFKGYYQIAELPDMNMGKLLFHVGMRYTVHMILSLIILWVVFMEKGILKFALVLFGFLFVILMGVFFYLLHSYQVGEAGSLFYTRRFLIQPLLIFILLPAFFYYRKVNS